MNIRRIKSCPECASKNIGYVDSKEQIICRDCGDIFEPTIEDVKKSR